MTAHSREVAYETAPARVVVVAMKPQLRGRIRRNVITLLQLGADVTVVNTVPREDFFLGLEHPRLRAHFIDASSVARRYSERVARQTQRRRQRRDGEVAVVEPARPPATGPTVAQHGQPLPPAERGETVGKGGSAHPEPRRLSALARRLSRALARRLSRALARRLRPWRRRVRPVTRRPRKAWRILKRRSLRSYRWFVRRFRVVRRWRILRRRSVRARRRLVRRWRRSCRWFVRRFRVVRRWRVRTTRDLLRPTHRVNRFVEFWYASARYVQAQSPDLVVSSDLPGLVGASIAARRLKKPHVHDCHELYLESTALRPFEQRILRPVEAVFMRRVDSIVMVNQTIADEYRSRYGVASRVVRNCAPAVPDSLPAVDLRAVASLSPEAQVVLYQGGLAEGRGLEVCIAAVKWFPARAHLVMLGYGRLRGQLLELAVSHGVSDRVHLLDAVLPHELASHTVSASVGLIPYLPVSQNNRYALPNKVFEYTGVGVPFVASDLPELRRIAQEAGCGAVYDPFDPHALAEAVGVVLSVERHADFRRAARAYGRANTWESERGILVEELSCYLPGSRDAERVGVKPCVTVDNCSDGALPPSTDSIPRDSPDRRPSSCRA